MVCTIVRRVLAVCVIGLFAHGAAASMHTRDQRSVGTTPSNSLWELFDHARAGDSSAMHVGGKNARACDRFVSEKERLGMGDTLTEVMGGFYNSDVAAMFA